jgi:deoxyribose-phosphate aldolase
MIVQRFDVNGQHQLVNTKTGKTTEWATYESITYMDGYVGHTAYFSKTEGILSADAFCRLLANDCSSCSSCSSLD